MMKDNRVIVRKRKRLIVGIGLMVFVMLLNFPFPHEKPFAAGNVSVMNIPIQDMDGFKFGGLVLLVILVVGIYLFGTSLEKYRARLVILAIFLYFLLPFFLINVYQNTLASGIYAIDYGLDESVCEFKKMDDKRLSVMCDLPFENFSDDEVTFDVRFGDEPLFEERFKVVPLMNENAPYTVSLQGDETKVVRIETELAISRVNGLDGGTTHQVHIEISQGNRMRRL
ncbi:hypothetical protein MHH33_17030 [Paenisporosarcina sp. FSL H8-0542]|uniref:hypothetical protein n=1 Tax=Paenisporosarcina sp. FSL H8-0542 TaxID=2921401 RepID=UPI00315A0A88